MNELQRKLLSAYKDKPEGYMGALVVSNILSIPESERGYNCFGIHKELLELKKMGYLKQKYKKGFKYSL